MLTVHVVTKNNAKTIQNTLDSVKPLNCPVKITDLGSSDGTPSLVRRLGYDVEHMEADRDAALGKSSFGKSGWHFLIRPGEILAEGHRTLATFRGTAANVRLIRDSFISYEVRVWTGETGFRNPVWPYPTVESDKLIGVNLFGSDNNPNAMSEVMAWQAKAPTLGEPRFCKAMILFAQGKYKEFMAEAEQYIFLEKKSSRSVVMTRYHHALANLLTGGKASDSLKQLNLCVCVAPLMAEFWCAMGDVYYHRLGKFEDAIQFYENAMFLGAKRMSTDLWPMDIMKYEEYPKQMIDSCRKIICHRAIYSVRQS
jgi:tetratricopeptide (TPR) repeat protein